MNRARTSLMLIVLFAGLTGCVRNYEQAFQSLDVAEQTLSQYDQYVQEKNQELANSAKDKAGDLVDEGKAQLSEYARAKIDEIMSDLTTDIKDDIDAWIAEHGLNQYGDPDGTMYAGGTPLFDEMTGETQDRYEYILEHNPELLDELNLSQR